MIKYKVLRFSNAFSYGENNELRLDESTLTQLVGKNGNGKSSLALILEEVQFNTNSKKIKKVDVLNRYTKAKSYTIELEFEKDGVPYTISTTRTSTTGTVKLLCNGKDISSHTATGTYKQIEQVLGFDNKTFSQIVYQSSVSSLEFLTATDTARKKFLIDLLNLGKYTKASEVFKDLANTLSKHIDITQAKLNTVQSWLAKYKDVDLAIKDVKEEPLPPTSILEQITLLSNELTNIVATNKKITQNLTYKSILESIDITTQCSKPDNSMVKEYHIELSEVTKALEKGLALKCSGPVIKCPTCSQDMDNSVMYNRVQEFALLKDELLAKKEQLTVKIKIAEQEEAAWKTYNLNVQEWEKYHALYDPNLAHTPLDANTLNEGIKTLTAKADTITAAITAARASNNVAISHNAKVRVIIEQMEDMRTDAKVLGDDLLLKIDELSKLQVLVKTFSTTGLVAYKIECLVKDLEALTNEYLGVLANGRFQLSFVVVADKLNVVITDTGRDIGIEALSTGERARVNVATLLAIRKLMQALSNSRTNLLILDETISNLDPEGKEKLIEVLLEEKDLNTFLVAHDYSHPLLDKITVVKENNISRIE